MSYSHLSIQEREQLMILLQKGYSLRRIAAQLGRSVSTISEEIRRNSKGPEQYRAHRAQKLADKRRHKRRRQPILEKNPKLRQYVSRALRYEQWSPEQIAGRLKAEYEHDPSMWVSHETIYQFIIRKVSEGKLSYARNLRQGKVPRSYGWRGKKRFRRIRDYKSIEERPAEVDRRRQLGHWESDTLRGTMKSSAGIAVHVERKSGYVVLAKVKDRKAATYNRATLKAFQREGILPVKTLTVDHGMEFGCFKQLEQMLGAEVYFARPHHPWQRAIVEHVNGLLRQYFPKGCDLSRVPPRTIARIQRKINTRPCKRLGFLTPSEAALCELFGLQLESAALEVAEGKVPRFESCGRKSSKACPAKSGIWKYQEEKFQDVKIVEARM